MLNVIVRAGFLLAVVFALPILVIRAMPYHDRINGALVADDCPSPCFLGIRPGVTTMQGAVYLLQAHPWVSNGRNGFSSQVLSAVFYDAGLPRTSIGVGWTENAPPWIDGAQRSAVTVEDREVLNIAVGTHLSLGEIVLAFGDPDESWYIVSNSGNRRRFEYIAWYATERMLITTEGSCPMWHYYTYPTRILFRPQPPGTSESVSKASVCR
jgi:hypothetical protein